MNILYTVPEYWTYLIINKSLMFFVKSQARIEEFSVLKSSKHSSLRDLRELFLS
jgi:hypothetical protein